MVKTVLMDLDDTILDFRKAEASAIANTLLALGLDSSGQVCERYHAINKRHWGLLEEGKITRAQVKRLRFVRLFEELGAECDVEKVCRLYEENLAGGAFLIPGALALLEELAPRYDLYIASNGGAAVQNARLDAAGIRKYFKGQFISEDLGANKPSPAFFEACFRAIPGFARETAVIVGDSLSSDIRGGRNVGLRTIWFHPEGEPGDIQPDHVIRSLGELPGLLERL